MVSVEQLPSFEQGPIRPPSEATSLLLRLTRNCPWNKCAFCHTYKTQKFSLRSVEEIKQDVLAAKQLAHELYLVSWKKGFRGLITKEIVAWAYHTGHQSLFHVAWWLFHGGKTVFLQDANSLIMRTSDLADVLSFIKQTFPQVERITSYARSFTLAKKDVAELKELKDAGLTRIHVGVESGSDKVLEFIKKGATAAHHLKAGLAVKEAGISLCLYVILGLGGRNWWQEHAQESGKVVSAINPDFLRLRTLAVPPNSLLSQKINAGEFTLPTEDEIVQEEALLLESLSGFTGYLASDHSVNLLMEIEGQFPEAKSRSLAVIATYQKLSNEDKQNFKLGRRLGIYSCLEDLQDTLKRHQVDLALRKLKETNQDLEATLAFLRTRVI